MYCIFTAYYLQYNIHICIQINVGGRFDLILGQVPFSSEELFSLDRYTGHRYQGQQDLSL